MKVIVKPAVLQGHLHVPSSKSAMQRALALAWLHGRSTKIINPGISNDDHAALGIIQQLGAATFFDGEGNLHVDASNRVEDDITINCGESGLSVRMFAPVVATLPQQITLTGSGSLVRRPLNFIEEVLPKLGVDVVSSGGKIPLRIKGPYSPKALKWMVRRAHNTSPDYYLLLQPLPKNLYTYMSKTSTVNPISI